MKEIKWENITVKEMFDLPASEIIVDGDKQVIRVVPIVEEVRWI